MKYSSFKKVSDGQSDKHVTTNYVFISLQIIIIQSQKKMMWDSTKPWN